MGVPGTYYLRRDCNYDCVPLDLLMTDQCLMGMSCGFHKYYDWPLNTFS